MHNDTAPRVTRVTSTNPRQPNSPVGDRKHFEVSELSSQAAAKSQHHGQGAAGVKYVSTGVVSDDMKAEMFGRVPSSMQPPSPYHESLPIAEAAPFLHDLPTQQSLSTNSSPRIVREPQVACADQWYSRLSLGSRDDRSTGNLSNSSRSSTTLDFSNFSQDSCYDERHNSGYQWQEARAAYPSACHLGDMHGMHSQIFEQSPATLQLAAHNASLMALQQAVSTAHRQLSTLAVVFKPQTRLTSPFMTHSQRLGGHATGQTVRQDRSTTSLYPHDIHESVVTADTYPPCQPTPPVLLRDSPTVHIQLSSAAPHVSFAGTPSRRQLFDRQSSTPSIKIVHSGSAPTLDHFRLESQKSDTSHYRGDDLSEHQEGLLCGSQAALPSRRGTEITGGTIAGTAYQAAATQTAVSSLAGSAWPCTRSCSGSCRPDLQKSEQLCCPRPTLRTISSSAWERLRPTENPVACLGSGNAFSPVPATMEEPSRAVAPKRCRSLLPGIPRKTCVKLPLRKHPHSVSTERQQPHEESLPTEARGLLSVAVVHSTVKSDANSETSAEANPDTKLFKTKVQSGKGLHRVGNQSSHFNSDSRVPGDPVYSRRKPSSSQEQPECLIFTPPCSAASEQDTVSVRTSAATYSTVSPQLQCDRGASLNYGIELPLYPELATTGAPAPISQTDTGSGQQQQARGPVDTARSKVPKRPRTSKLYNRGFRRRVASGQDNGEQLLLCDTLGQGHVKGSITALNELRTDSSLCAGDQDNTVVNASSPNGCVGGQAANNGQVAGPQGARADISIGSKATVLTSPISHTKILVSRSYNQVLCLTKAMVADLLPTTSTACTVLGSSCNQTEIDLVDPAGTIWPVTFRNAPSRYSYEFRAGWRAVALAWDLSLGDSVALIRRTSDRHVLHLQFIQSSGGKHKTPPLRPADNFAHVRTNCATMDSKLHVSAVNGVEGTGDAALATLLHVAAMAQDERNELGS